MTLTPHISQMACQAAEKQLNDLADERRDLQSTQEAIDLIWVGKGGRLQQESIPDSEMQLVNADESRRSQNCTSESLNSPAGIETSPASDSESDLRGLQVKAGIGVPSSPLSPEVFQIEDELGWEAWRAAIEAELHMSNLTYFAANRR